MANVRRLVMDANALSSKLRELSRAGREFPPLFTAEQLGDAAGLVEALAIVALAYDRKQTAEEPRPGVVRLVRVALTQSGMDALRYRIADLRRLAAAFTNNRAALGIDSIADVLELLVHGEGDPLLIEGARPGELAKGPPS